MTTPTRIIRPGVRVNSSNVPYDNSGSGLSAEDLQEAIDELAAGGGAIPATILDAKGDLIVASAADTPAILTVGANDTIPMADSGQTVGIKWVGSQTPSTQAFSDSAAEGTADTFARGDHKHGMPASPGGGSVVGISGPVIYPQATDLGASPGTGETLATSGGSIIIPYEVVAPFNLRNYRIRNLDTSANLRTAEARLFAYGGTTMDFVTGTDATFSFTPAGSPSERNSGAVSGTTVVVSPGVYWLVIRNTSGAQAFVIGYANLAATFWNQNPAYYTQAGLAALGSTVTLAGWSGQARSIGAVLYSNSGFGV